MLTDIITSSLFKKLQDKISPDWIQTIIGLILFNLSSYFFDKLVEFWDILSTFIYDLYIKNMYYIIIFVTPLIFYKIRIYVIFLYEINMEWLMFVYRIVNYFIYLLKEIACCFSKLLKNKKEIVKKEIQPEIKKQQIKRKKFSCETIIILKTTYEQNSHPSSELIKTLALETNLNETQIRDWFKRERKNLKNKLCS